MQCPINPQFTCVKECAWSLEDRCAVTVLAKAMKDLAEIKIDIKELIGTLKLESDCRIAGMDDK